VWGTCSPPYGPTIILIQPSDWFKYNFCSTVDLVQPIVF
jgi:hypothetical protein